MIHEHDGEHRLVERGGADSHAGIVPAERGDIHGLALYVYRLSRKADAGSGFEGDAHQDVLPGRNAAEDAPGVIREKPLRRDFIAMFRALVFDAAKAGADLNAFDRI